MNTLKVFITGGSGYIGRATIEVLRRQGHEVAALARSDESARTVSELGATPVRGSLTDTDVLREAASQADGVIHLGQNQSEDTGDIDRAAAAAMQDGVGSGPYVHTGGAWIYGNTDGVVGEDAPFAPPQITAWRIENEKRVLARAESGGHPVVVMPGIVYGRAGGVPQLLLVNQGRANGVVPCIGDGDNRWALVHVEDLAELYVLALGAPAGSVYAGAGGQNVAFKDIANAASSAAGCAGNVHHLTLDEARGMLGLLADALVLDQQFSGERARRELGWRPTHQDALTVLAQG
ncbi:NAD-dependent epimerase/dehydratase family protein [Streptomyces sp. GbtcB7]|uniref:NAD-dependent epimerase/dehydratase family protein n=1 Tax=Streptomyces sp. GbtcB7 TaxID=2824752 RepID=UPI0027E531EE|nr:NAD-dependent epimerase/dehydratase family protein [Streptomyces sp. GbtcB7]